LISQAIAKGIFPRLKIKHTSEKVQGQVCILNKCFLFFFYVYLFASLRIYQLCELLSHDPFYCCDPRLSALCQADQCIRFSSQFRDVPYFSSVYSSSPFGVSPTPPLYSYVIFCSLHTIIIIIISFYWRYVPHVPLLDCTLRGCILYNRFCVRFGQHLKIYFWWLSPNHNRTCDLDHYAYLEGWSRNNR